MMEPMALNLALPWNVNAAQDEKFVRLVKKSLAPLLALFLIVPWLPVFEVEYIEPEDALVKTKVLLDLPEVKEKKPPAPKPKPKPKQKPVAKPKQKIVEAAAAKSTANGQAALAALSSSLSGIGGGVDLNRMQNKNVSHNSLGKVQRSNRSLLGEDSATRTSGGVVVDDMVMNTDGGLLAGHKSTEVESPLGGGTGPANSRGYGASLDGHRDMESIRRIFERKKSSVYALYSQALRSSPELSGKFTFELTIQPDGSITQLRLLASELHEAELERSILARIQNIRFGAEDVLATPVQYKFVFLPS